MGWEGIKFEILEVLKGFDMLFVNFFVGFEVELAHCIEHFPLIEDIS